MKRSRIGALLCLLLTALLLVGCGDGGESGDYENYDAWVEALGFTPNTPASLPGKDFSENYAIEEGNVAKATYANPDQVIICRTAQGEDLNIISFDGYPVEAGVSTCRGYDIVLYGTEEGAHAAQWSEGGKTFAVFFQQPVTQELFDEFISYI